MAGNYNDSLKNIRGCDSIITQLTLAVDTIKRVTKTVSLCAGQTYTLPGGTILSAAGNYTDTVKNIRGCDSLITLLNLTVATVGRVTINANVCDGKSYLLPSLKLVTVSGAYVDTLKAIAGCDSLITTTNLVVLNTVNNNSTASICSGESYTLPNNKVVYVTGIYKDTLRYTNGCDSVHRTVTLTVNPKPDLGADKTLKFCVGNSVDLTNQYNTTGLTTEWFFGGVKVATPTTVSTAGIYLLIATNTSNCTDTAFVTISISQKPTLGSDKASSICAGSVIDLSTQFITAGLVTNWSLAGVLLTNVNAVNISGAYQLIAATSDGCMDTAFFVLTVNANPNLGNDTAINICSGNNYNLTTHYTFTGLTYVYTLNGTVVTNPSTVSKAGIYQIIATNNNGCADTAFVSLTINPKPDLGNNTSAAICAPNIFDLSTQVITTNLTSEWTLNGAIITTPTLITTGGIYQLIVTNASGCKDTALVNLTVNPKPTIGVDKAINICEGNTADLNTIFTTTGLASNWTLSGATVSNPSAVFTGGTYQLIVTNSTNCTDTALVTITIDPKPALGADKNVSICFGNTVDLTKIYTTTGLTTTYTLNGTTVAAPAAVSVAGKYQLIVINNSNCSDTAFVTITVNAKPAIGPDSAISICEGNIVDLTKLYNTNGLTTNWFVNGTNVSNPSAISTNGMYQLIVVNSNGCEDTAMVTITIKTKPSLGADKTFDICAGNTVDLTTQFVTTDLISNWTKNGVLVSNSASVNAAGNYQLLVTNISGCADTAIVSINITPKPALGANKSVTICQVNSVDLTTVFNTIGLTTEWTIGGTIVSTPTAINQAGIYQLIVSNSNGCSDTALYNITVNSSPVLGADKQISFCTGASLNITNEFITAGLSSNWSLNGIAVTTPDFITKAGNYQLIVTNNFNCPDTAMINVIMNALPVIVVADPAPVCSPSTVNITAASVTAGSTNALQYTYWLDAAAIKSYTSPTSATSGLYFIKGVDTNGCTDILPVSIIVYPKPVAYAGNDTIICSWDYAVLRGSASSNPISTLSYLWTPAGKLTNANQIITLAKATVSTEYTFTVTANYGVCTATATDKIWVKMQPPVIAFAGNDTNVVSGMPHQLSASGGVSYLWNPSANLNNAAINNPIATVLGNTRFTVLVTDVAGCKDTASVLLRVFNGISYQVANAFSPNGDGINETFRPIGVGIVATERFQVFNRYGVIMYESTNLKIGWDGNFKGIKQPIGNYVWSIRGLGRDGKMIEMKGNVLLLR